MIPPYVALCLMRAKETSDPITSPYKMALCQIALFSKKIHAYLSISVISLGNLSLNNSIISESYPYQYLFLSSVNSYFTNIINLTILAEYDAHIHKFEN
jgi:hypothetical protein